MSTIIDTLVCDRSQNDVDRAFLLKHKILTQGLSTLSDDEKTEYMAGMKDIYNHTDPDCAPDDICFRIFSVP